MAPWQFLFSLSHKAPLTCCFGPHSGNPLRPVRSCAPTASDRSPHEWCWRSNLTTCYVEIASSLPRWFPCGSSRHARPCYLRSGQYGFVSLPRPRKSRTEDCGELDQLANSCDLARLPKILVPDNSLLRSAQTVACGDILRADLGHRFCLLLRSLQLFVKKVKGE